MKRLALALMLALAPLAARAQCVGQNLFEAMPATEQAALRAAADAVPYARGILYRATRGDEAITLVGTYHLPDPRHDETLDALTEALDGAGLVLVEATAEDEAELQRRMMTDPTLMFSTGPTLPELLSEEDWQALSAAMATRGMPAFLVAKMNPFFAAIMLAIPPCAMRAVQGGAMGLDKMVMAEADAKGIPVAALESPDAIFDLFLQAAQEDGVGMIRAALIAERQGDDGAVTMADLYFAGEPRLIWELGQAQALAGGMDPETVAREMEMTEELMMNARNRAWIPVIEEALAAGQGPIVVAAGALHLPGDEGLVRLLESRGFTVEAVQR